MTSAPFAKPIEREDWFAYALLTAALGLLFLGAPVAGDFFWSDAPRHALNGVFVKDLFRDMPLSDPVGYAESYYLQYPALTILLYPPLFYFISAPAFALFGVSHETALAVVLVHYIALAFGAHRLFRFWLDPVLAFASALLLISLPEIAFWGRQVMLEIPAMAFAVWSAVFFVGYLRNAEVFRLYLAATLLVLAIYTKFNVAYLAVVYAAALISLRGLLVLRDRHLYIVGALSILALVPAAFLTLKFGQANVQSLTGIADAAVSRASIWGWLWYAFRIPAQMGPLPMVASMAGLGALLVRRNRVPPKPSDIIFWVGWFVAGYLFFSSIDLKETRHSIFLLPALVLCAVLPLKLFAPKPAAAGVALGLAVGALIGTAFFRPVFFVSGHAHAASRVADLAPPRSSVVFSGYRDGSFIFSMRTHENRQDLAVVRADKLLLRISVRRELGVEEKGLTSAEILATLTRLRAAYVVAETGFWTDLEAMQRFEEVLKSGAFEVVERIRTKANYPASDRELVIYRHRGPLPDSRSKLENELPIINRSIDGAANPD